jgi:hypothetical protein
MKKIVMLSAVAAALYGCGKKAPDTATPEEGATGAAPAAESGGEAAPAEEGGEGGSGGEAAAATGG